MGLQTYAITNDGSYLLVTNTDTGSVESWYLPAMKGITYVCQASVTHGDGMYPHPDLNVVTVEFSDRESDLNIILERVTNQVGWTPDEPGCIQAVDDIRGWVNTVVAGIGASATEATLQQVLTELQKGKDYELALVKDTGNADQIVSQVRLWDQTTGTLGAPTYYDVSGAVYVPVGPLTYLDTEGAVLALLNEVATSTTRTPSIIRATNAVGSPIAPGSRQVLCYNAGTADGSFVGATIKPGESFPLNAGGENDVLGPVSYDGTGTELVIITII